MNEKRVNMTVHNEAKKGEIAKKVIMPGDPLRAKRIAENFLEDAVLVNRVRGMYAYTGTYKGEKITVMASGMGCPSMGIYSYELFKFYDVEQIIRVGSAGAYSIDIPLFDMVLVSSSLSNSNYAYMLNGTKERECFPDKELNNHIKEKAKELGMNLREGKVYSTDAFYTDLIDPNTMYQDYHLLCAEMESFALLENAKFLHKKAACILTISDNIVTHEETTSAQRQDSFHQMITLALESCL